MAILGRLSFQILVACLIDGVEHVLGQDGLLGEVIEVVVLHQQALLKAITVALFSRISGISENRLSLQKHQLVFNIIALLQRNRQEW